MVKLSLLLVAAAAFSFSGVFAQNDSQKNDSSACVLNNICFALDQSGSIGRRFYPDIQDFTVQAALEINRRTSNTTYSAYGFANSERLIQAPTTDLNGTFIPAIRQTPSFGSTNIAAGLQACFNVLRNVTGNRAAVLVTDGRPSAGGSPLALKPVFANAGIGLVTVAIGSGVDSNLLRNLATNPSFFISVDNTPELVAKAINITNSVCQVVPSVTSGGCQAAYDQCKFKFAKQDSLPTYNLARRPDTIFTNRIVSKGNETLGVLNTNGISVDFISGDGASPITMFASPRFTPTHFKPFPFKNPILGSGIGVQTLTGNQSAEAVDKCVRVSFSSYQMISIRGSMADVKNMNDMKKKDNNCVVFRTK